MTDMSDQTTNSGNPPAETMFFSRTFDEAMELTREARDYLAEYGDGDASGMPEELRMHFSAETMRLTARLTHSMAWLMAQRAAHQGELTFDELKEDDWRLGGHEVCLGPATLDPAALPPYLRDLLRRSRSLFERIARLDAMIAE
jgi:regulator of CtrA degradation